MANKDRVASTSMAIGEFDTISVDPDVLRETAEAAFRQIGNYRQGLEAISKVVESSADFWTGEAGDAYRQVFRAELSKIEEVLDDYAAYPRDLLAYAQVYSEAIAKAEGHAADVTEFPMA